MDNPPYMRTRNERLPPVHTGPALDEIARTQKDMPGRATSDEKLSANLVTTVYCIKIVRQIYNTQSKDCKVFS